MPTKETSFKLAISGNGKVVKILEFNSQIPSFEVINSITVPAQPSWLHLMSDGRHLLINSEDNPGSVSIYKINSDKSNLQLLDTVPSDGSAPAFHTTSSSEKTVLVANYNAGNVKAISLTQNSNNDLIFNKTAASHYVNFQHYPLGPRPDRQEASHPHMIQNNPYSSNTNLFYVPDLGTDRIHLLQLKESETSDMSLELIDSFLMDPGSGPRHVAFHPNGKRGYIVSELTSEVVFVDLSVGIQKLQTLNVLPPGKTPRTPDMKAAEVHVTRDGKWLYVSNRMDLIQDTIAVIELDSEGRMGNVSCVMSGGINPRGWGFSKSETWVAVGNEDSGNVVMFERDSVGGGLNEFMRVNVGDDVLPTAVVWL